MKFDRKTWGSCDRAMNDLLDALQSFEDRITKLETVCADLLQEIHAIAHKQAKAFLKIDSFDKKEQKESLKEIAAKCLARHKKTTCDKSSQFQVGWVYKNKKDIEYLVVHIWDDGRDYPMIGSKINPASSSGFIYSYTLKGKYYCHSEDKEDLILSTGRPYKKESK